MNLQDKSITSIDNAIKEQDFLNRTPFYGHEKTIDNLTEFDKELDLEDYFELDDADNFDFNDTDERFEIKKVKIPPLFSERSERPIFANFLDFEAHYIYDNELRDNVDLVDSYVTLTNECQFFPIAMQFSDSEPVLNQIKYYKTIINNIARLKNKLNKVMKILKANNITETPKIVLANSYNDLFSYWGDEASHLVPACYQSDTIYLFVNYKLKRGLKRRDTRNSLLHEFGHMIENRLYGRYSTVKNKYSGLVRQDFKLALKEKTSRFLNYKRYAAFYDHVAPPTRFTKLQHNEVISSTPAFELFAESFSYSLELGGRKIKRRYKKVNSPILNEMFPNTNYIVKQTIRGKSVNKYKVLKQKKLTKMIKL
jgi:hypothetical protein